MTELPDPALGQQAVFRASLTLPDGMTDEVEHAITIADEFDYGG